MPAKHLEFLFVFIIFKFAHRKYVLKLIVLKQQRGYFFYLKRLNLGDKEYRFHFHNFYTLDLFTSSVNVINNVVLITVVLFFNFLIKALKVQKLIVA